MIEARGIRYAYGMKKPMVLDDFNLTINEGEILALLGPNGIGKSTAISILSGLKKPLEGNIEIDGKSIYEYKPSERGKKIGLVGQFPEFGNLSIYESILLGRLPNFVFAPCKHDKKAADEIVRLIGLEKIKDKSVNELSGGERQLVAIGRALVNHPSFLLLDEPTSNLDIQNKLSVLRLIKNAAKNSNVSVLISLHDLNEAFQIADKFAFMKEGKIEGIYTKDTIDETKISSIYGVAVTLLKDKGKLNMTIKEDL